MRLINPASGEDDEVPGPAHGPAGLHTASPLLASCRQRDGAPASLMQTSHYPVEATCQVCDQPIRTERFYSAVWDHIERFTTADPVPSAG